MVRRLAPLLLILALSPPARAVPITGYAFGHITEDLSASVPGFVSPIRFAVGERVTLRYTYDLDPPDPIWGNRPSIEVEMFTGGGFSNRMLSPSVTNVQGEWPDLRLRLSADPRRYDLQFIGGDGSLLFDIDFPNGVAGFRAGVIRTDTFLPVDFPAPEPSGLVMGLTGAGLLGLAWNKRRTRANGLA